LFRAARPWEITSKRGLGRDDFRVDPHLLRRGLLDNGYLERSITSQHAVGVDALPTIHCGPLDRLRVSQVDSRRPPAADARRRRGTVFKADQGGLIEGAQMKQGSAA